MKKLKVGFVVGALFLSGCVDANREAVQVGAPRTQSLQIRQMQTASFSNVPERRVLQDSTQVLQDLGFSIDESSADLGLLAGSKDRDATEAGEVAAAIALTVIAAVFLVAVVPSWDERQTIRATLSTRPLADRSSAEIRVSFERRVTTNQGVSRFDSIEDPALYAEFFQLLRQSLATMGR